MKIFFFSFAVSLDDVYKVHRDDDIFNNSTKNNRYLERLDI